MTEKATGDFGNPFLKGFYTTFLGGPNPKIADFGVEKMSKPQGSPLCVLSKKGLFLGAIPESGENIEKCGGPPQKVGQKFIEECSFEVSGPFYWRQKVSRSEHCNLILRNPGLYP